MKKVFVAPAGQSVIEVTDLDKIVEGTYILQFITDINVDSFKIMKLKD